VSHLSALVPNFAEEFMIGGEDSRLISIRLQGYPLNHACKEVVPAHRSAGMKENVVVVGVPKSLDAVSHVNSCRPVAVSDFCGEREWQEPTV